jgi:hypothetical protein
MWRFGLSLFIQKLLFIKLYLGGDCPEAIAPALHAAAHTLSWRKNAVKIALLIADAPPHGLQPAGDTWPNGRKSFV